MRMTDLPHFTPADMAARFETALTTQPKTKKATKRTARKKKPSLLEEISAVIAKYKEAGDGESH